MSRLASFLGRLGVAVTLALLALAVARWRPIAAATPVEVRALPLALPAIGFAVTAALTGRPRRPVRWRPVLAALGLAVLALAGAVAGRGPAGLPAEVSGASGLIGATEPGPIDVVGRDLRMPAMPRRVTLRWTGALRLPESGLYRLWVEGRGRATVVVHGHTLLQGEGNPLAAEVAVALARGTVPIEVALQQTAPGPRLRLGWTRPDGRREAIPVRYLGPPLPAWRWWLTDTLAVVVALLLGVLAWLLPWDRPQRVPLPRPVTAGEVAVSMVGHMLLLAVMSWPMVRDLAHTGPMDRPDGRVNAWILGWVGSTVWTEPSRVFQAPACHPLPDTLAFTENLLLPAALSAPLQRWSGPVLAYDATLLGSLLLSGLAAQLLVRRVTGDRLAAFVAGACFAAGPQRWIRLAHLHAQLTVFLPLALLAFDRFWERRSLRRALVVGVMLGLQGLASIYLGAITAAALAVAVAIAVFAGLRPRELGRLVLGFLVAAAMLAPVLRPYLRMRAFEGQEFSLETVANTAATLPSYAAAGTAAWGWLTERLLDPAALRDALFPGLTLLVLGIAGLARAPRRYRAVAIAASVVAFVFSLGPETAFYRFLYEHVVLIRGVRALARFSLVPVLSLCVLTGLALAGRARVLAWSALALVMVESANLPLRLQRYDGPSPAARWLAGRPGAVLVLPLAENDTKALLDGLAHRRPLVNGSPAFVPRPFDRAMELFANGLGDEGLRFLRAVGVTDVVLDGSSPAAALRPGVREVASFPDERVAEVVPGDLATVVGPGDPVATRWTPAGVVVVLPQPRDLERVVFELSDGEWVTRPRLEVSDDGLSWHVVDATASLADATLSLYRNPTRGRGAIRFAPVTTRFLRLDARLPARPGAVEVGPAQALP
ncbi:MAG TPA: PA14 domain-containing protein [Vicinamibacteria bacterium]|nr:PA14 domain-containing protein [Vicinamibacteria bacterium]